MIEKMAIRTYSINEEIAEKFKNQTPKQKTSQELEKLMAEYIDEDASRKEEPIKILDRDLVSKRRRDLVKAMVDNSWFYRSAPEIMKKCRSEGLYQGKTAKHHFREAKNFLIRSDEVPIEKKGGKLVPEEFDCMNDGCEARLTLPALDSKDLMCPECGRRYVF